MGGDFGHLVTASNAATISVSYLNNNFYKSIANAGYVAFGLAGSGYANNSTFNFTNNIFDQGANGVQPRIFYANGAGGGVITQNNNLIVNYQSDYISGSFSTTRNNLTLGAGTLASVATIPYTNAAAGDFTIPSTSPVATAGVSGACLGAPGWIKLITDPAVITTSLSIVGAGTVSPGSLTVNKNDVVQLTATQNFGYRFVNWTKPDNTVVSTSSSFSYTVPGDINITANYIALNTYELSLSNSGGAPAYMVSVSPTGTTVNGHVMYEEGTTVTLTAYSNPLYSFTNWSDNQTSNTLILPMNQNRTLSATYSSKDYLAGWDFYKSGGINRAADFYSANNSAKTLILRKADGTTNSWLDKSNVANSTTYGVTRGSGVMWKVLADQYYYQTTFDATGYSDIKVSAEFSYSYNTYTTRFCQYSLDGTNFTTVGTYTMPSTGVWYGNTFTLPSNANNASSVTVRWIADGASTVNGSVALNNDGATIANVYVTGTATVSNDGNPPSLTSSVPAVNTSSASINGQIVLTFNEKVQLTSEQITGTLNNKSLTPSVSGNSLILPYTGLSYSQQYTFNLPGGSVADLSGNVLNSVVSVTFTTMPRPTVTKKNFDFVVGVDGDFGAAMTAASAASATGSRYRIFFPNGSYNVGTATGDANQMTTLSLPNVSFIGQNPDSVFLYNQNASGGIQTTATLAFTTNANNLYLQDLSLKNNDYRSGVASLGVCVALWDQGTKNIYKNVNLLSNQDTYVSGAGRTYFEGGSIHGTVDFICGGGDVFFNQSLLYLENRTGNKITAPATTQNWGYVFNQCTIDGFPATEGTYSLGRPWMNSPRSIYINTTMNVLPAAAGWESMGVLPALFAEYNSKNSLGASVDVGARATSFTVSGVPTAVTYNPVLTAEQAAAYTMENVLGGNDGWNPSLSTQQATTPDIKGVRRVISWSNDNYVACWGIFKNGRFVQFVTTNSYTIPNDDAIGSKYTVRAANEMGGLSAVSNTYTLNSTDYFRTTGSGNWSSLSSWQSSTNNSTWTGAAEIPTSSATDITISAGNVFIVDENATASSITLNSTAKLSLLPGDTLNVSSLNLQSDGDGTATFVNNGTAEITSANVDQYLATTRNWYVSSPVSNATLPTGYTSYLYREPGDNIGFVAPASAYWKSVVAGDPLTVGLGYIAKPLSDAQTLSFSGTLNDGDIPVVLTKTVEANKSGFNLIGNPYPSYLNPMAVINSNSQLEKTIWYRTRSGSYYFESVNTTSGVGTNNAGTGTVTGYIPPMQAFWVRVNGNTTLTFTNEMRYHSGTYGASSTTLLKAPAELNTEQSILRLKVSNGTNSDEAILVFNPKASNGYDVYDSEKMSNDNITIPEIYTKADTKELVINGLETVQYNTEIPLGFRTQQLNNFSLQLTELKNFDNSTHVYIFDKLNNTEYEITGETPYSFASEVFNGTSRFSIVLRSQSVVTQNDNNIEKQLYSYINAQNQIIVNSPYGLTINFIGIYSATGQLLNELKPTSNITVIPNRLAPGIYFVNIKTADKTISQKVVIK